MENLFVDRNIDNERGPAIVDDLKRRILVYKGALNNRVL